MVVTSSNKSTSSSVIGEHYAEIQKEPSKPRSKAKKNKSPTVCAILKDLMSGDRVMVKAAMTKVADLCSENNATQNRKDLVTVGGPLIIVGAMERHCNDADIQMKACTAMANMAMGDEEAQVLIACAGGIKSIIAAMKKFPQHTKLQHRACGACANIACSEDIKNLVVKFGGIPLILGAMKNHPDDADLQECACGALGNMSTGSQETKLAVVAGGGLSIISKAVETNFRNSDLRKCANYCLRILSEEE